MLNEWENESQSEEEQVTKTGIMIAGVEPDVFQMFFFNPWLFSVSLYRPHFHRDPLLPASTYRAQRIQRELPLSRHTETVIFSCFICTNNTHNRITESGRCSYLIWINIWLLFSNNLLLYWNVFRLGLFRKKSTERKKVGLMLTSSYYIPFVMLNKWGTYMNNEE